MAVVEMSQDMPIEGNTNFLRINWQDMIVGDTGEPFTLAQYADRSIQVQGIFGVGGLVVLEGSNDGVNFYTLNDPQGNTISFTTAKIEAVSEIVVAIRPRISGGDGTTSIAAVLLVRKN